MTTKRPRSWSLWTQVISVVLVLAIVCGILIGEIVSRIESQKMYQDMVLRTSGISALLSRIIAEDLVSGDRMNLAATLTQAGNDIDDLHFIDVMDEKGNLVSQWKSHATIHPASHFFEEIDIHFENEIVGILKIQWGFEKYDREIEDNLFSVRLYIIAGMLILGLLFILVIRRVIVVPVEQLHGGLDRVMQGGDIRDIVMPRYTSREFLDLRDAGKRVTGLIHEQAADRRKLRESEERFRNLIEGSIQGILVHRNFEPLFVNQAYADIFGYADLDELLKLSSVESLFATGELDRITDYDSKLTQNMAVPSNYEYRGETKGGKIIWLENRVRIVTWQGQSAIQSTVVDITNRKIAEEDLRRTRSQLLEAIDALPDGFVLFNEQDILVICNQKYRDIYSKSSNIIRPGSTFEEIVRFGMERGQYPEALGREEEWLAERLENHRNPSGSVEQELDSGQWLRILERRTESGGTVGFRIDITELKDREKALWESAERTRATVDTALDCIVQMDQYGKIIEFNPSAERTFGYKRHEAIGREMADLIIPARYSDAHRQGLKKYIETGEGPVLGQHIEIEAVRSDGTEFPITLSISVSQEAEGPNFVGYIRDTTEQRADAEALKIARDRAEIANKAKSEFLAMMSHEIRTPLNGVLGFLGLLQDTELNSNQAEYVQSGRRSAESLLDVINDILDFSKMEAGHLDFETVVFSPEEIVHDILDVIKPRADENHTKVIYESAIGGKTYLKGDPSRIRQVLLNLTSNAVKFTENGNVILRISSTTAQDGRIRLRAEVEDTGVGIDMKHHEELFSEFLTLTPTYSQKFQGTGLGLAISRRLINHMDGTIDFTSELGKGSTFWFEVDLEPATEKEISASLETMSQDSHDTTEISFDRLRNIRILLAEDNPANQVVARAMLEKEQLQVDVVANGLEAVKALTARPYDLVLMDIGMPEMDGLEATAAIRKLPGKRSRTPIIAMTAHVMQGDRESILDNGMDDYMSKPIRKSILLRKISRWIEISEKPSDDIMATSIEHKSDLISESILILNERALEDLGNDTEFSLLPELIDTYLGSMDERKDFIASALITHDMERIELEAHSLKSSSATFGADRLNNLSLELEQAAARSDVDKVTALASELEKQCFDAHEALEQYSQNIKNAE
ncbi:MAG: PAS domain S-box protein [Sneathiella sp.]|uniref:PAS domain-containing hybrid sensor histidine kinase/response regulator n=1 Tax=Sneathiella sp. TaxID=1964365 RepID=UPI0030037458